MTRPALLYALAALALGATHAAAQSSGGETLAPEVLATPGAAQMIRESVFARLQLLQSIQQLRGPATAQTGVPGAALNTNTTAADRADANQQALGRAQAFAASRARAAADPGSQNILIDQSHRLTVNAVGSPIAIGNNNIVRQQVANTSAISIGAPANATATIDAAPAKQQGAAQSASGSATSVPR